MPVQGCRIELSKNIYLVDVAVETVGDWYIYEPVVSTKWNSRLRSIFRQRIQAGPSTTTQDNAKHGLQKTWSNSKVSRIQDAALAPSRIDVHIPTVNSQAAVRGHFTKGWIQTRVFNMQVVFDGGAYESDKLRTWFPNRCAQP